MCCSTKIRNITKEKKTNKSFFLPLIKDLSNREKMSNTIVISRELFLKKDVLSMLKVGWAINKEALKKVFKDNGIEIEDEADLKELADLHNTGKDKNGSTKDEKGNPMFFDVIAIIASEKTITDNDFYKALQEGKIEFVD